MAQITGKDKKRIEAAESAIEKVGKPQRKRNRASRRTRQLRNNNKMPSQQPTKGGNTRFIRRNQTAKFSTISQPSFGNFEKVRMYGLLAGTKTLDFIQATTHPFGPEGVGAVIPDKFQDLISPTYDYFSLDIDLPSRVPVPNVVFTAFAAVILPRCYAAGLFSGAKGTSGINNWAASLVMVNDKWEQIFVDNTSSTDQSVYIWTDPYYLLLIPVDDNNHCVAAWEAAQTFGVPGAYLMRFPKTSPINDNSNAFRIVGAGMKLNTRAAQINASGNCFGGQIQYETITGLLSTEHFNTATPSNGQFGDLQHRFVGKVHDSKGIIGCGARYNIFQCYDQLNEQQTTIKFDITAVNQQYISYLDGGCKKAKKKDFKIPKPMSTDSKLDFEDIEEEFTIPMRKLKKQKNSKIEVMCDEKDGEMEYKADTKADVNVVKRRNKTIITVDNKNNFGDLPTGVLNTATLQVSNPVTDKNDLCDPSTLLPVVYYQFNEGESQQLQLKIVVHGCASPKPTFPFIGSQVAYEATWPICKQVCADPGIFPYVTAGNSFKSAVTKFNKIFGRVLSGATKAHKVSQLLETVL
jgi:hypothetical protein